MDATASRELVATPVRWNASRLLRLHDAARANHGRVEGSPPILIFSSLSQRRSITTGPHRGSLGFPCGEPSVARSEVFASRSRVAEGPVLFRVSSWSDRVAAVSWRVLGSVERWLTPCCCRQPSHNLSKDHQFGVVEPRRDTPPGGPPTSQSVVSFGHRVRPLDRHSEMPFPMSPHATIAPTRCLSLPTWSHSGNG